MLVVCGVGGLASPALAAQVLPLAAPIPLTVSVDRPLSLLGDSLQVDIQGRSSSSLQGCRLVVRMKGPAAFAQLRDPSPVLPEAGKFVVELGETPSGPAGTSGASYLLGNSESLARGVLEARVILPADSVALPGAYLIAVEVKQSEEVVASGRAWVGKVASRAEPIDLAVVWPVFLGVHRDPEGVFFDDVLEQVVAPPTEGEGDLRALLRLPERFPTWSFTLALEPVVLAQLRDMSDGYLRREDLGSQTEVTAEEAPVQGAQEVLELLRNLASHDNVEVAAVPYASPDLGLLAARGWRDGLDQVQWGKDELLESLGLRSPPKAGCPFGLTLTEGSLAYFAQASVDPVVVDRGLLGLVTEPVPEDAVAVRVRDAENDRVTLVLASSGLISLADEPWDVGMFCAGMATELADPRTQALVVAPCRHYGLVPEKFLLGLGEAISGLDWLRTQTLSGLARNHLRDSRPLLLRAQYVSRPGYIEEVLGKNLEEAHAAVSDLGAVADATHLSVETAHRWLYLAESNWWSRDGVSPTEASVGLEYAQRARDLAQGELSRLQLVAADSLTVFGHEGSLEVTASNQAQYPFRVQLSFAGSGLTFPRGETIAVELAPGRNRLTVPLRGSGTRHLEVRLAAGQSVLAQASLTVRFVTWYSLMPWLILAALVLGAGAVVGARLVLARRRRQKRPGDARAGRGTA